MTRTEQMRELNDARWRMSEDRCLDAIELLQAGEHPASIATRLNTTVNALSKLLTRHGYRAESLPFERARGRKWAL
jgi:hypothetical protein